jgi:acetoin utilization protein AcuB
LKEVTMFVRTWMTSPVVVLPAETPILEALRIMELRRIHRVPVLRDGRLAGIVTRYDLTEMMGYVDSPSRQGQTLLEDLMKRPVVTVSPEDTIERAAQLMLDHKISGLPVVDGEEVLGILTESDVFRAFNKILGFWERGARIVISVPEEQDLLEAIKRRVGGLTVRSLAAYQTPQGTWEVVARVRGRRLASVT